MIDNCDAVVVLHDVEQMGYEGGMVPGDADLQTFCREHLAGYKVPRSFSAMSEIPRTASGKILKRELRQPFWAGRSSRVG